MGKREMKQAAGLVSLVVGLVVATLAALGWQAWRYPQRPSSGPAHQAKLVVEKGTSLSEIVRRLHERGIIDHPDWFRFYANERGLASKIRAGQYSFSSKMTPAEVLDKLVEGVPIEEATVTIPEGKNLVQLAALFDEAGICAGAEFEKVARDPQVARKLGVPNPTLEGYLYPDTYRFRRGTPAVQVAKSLVKHAHDVFSSIKARHQGGAASLERLYRFGEREIILMASLVEKETAQPEERPRIAGVFLNRLRLPTFVPHLLQTDPTIVYGCTVPLQKSAACQKFEGRIRRAHLDDVENPYNTYTHEGLPPGPISNPGRAAIEAVLAPDATPYLYFVSKNDGTHYFSKTLGEHEAAVEKYQRHRVSEASPKP
jgi:UPF0755 protein